MSEDRCKHSSQVFRVLGRTSSCRSREASKPGDAAAPILVTIARNGSIVSDHNTGRSSDTADNTPQASLATDRPLEMAQSPPAGRHSSRGRSIPGASPSIGTGSFVTARMFPSASFEERGTPAPWPGAAVAGPPRVALSGRRRQSDEVSDIAMHKHLQIGDGHIDGDGQSSHEAQAQHRTISQAIRQASLLSSRAGAARDLEASTLRLAGPEQASANDGLLGRMSDLETRLTCLQAVMTNIEERLSGLALGPSGSLTVVQPPAAGLASGKTPLVGVVGASTVASSAPATAVQSATAALAELVARSRQEFDAAASSTLASLAEIVDIAPTTEL
ncbi:hypothetical protein H4R21_001373 [Coemansia helicoidea]|uniref:Uncharacterized protein n=1 Tax=Coemansia helicoidea TaxID=1286919 RepID=A0ACC1LBY5_9FUNG|nr:hypothetical protein H4R21_001373 [Coemansia helicoidea]